MPILSGNAVLKSLVESGKIPANCCRVVIDFVPGDVVRIYYSTIPDERHIQDILDTIETKSLNPELVESLTLGDNFRVYKKAGT